MAPTRIRHGAVALALVALGAIAGCSDDSTAPTSSRGSVAATISGSTWSASDVQSTWQSGVLGIGGAQISGGNNRQINITGLVSAPTTVQLGLFSGITATYTEAVGGAVKIFVAQSGTLTVTTLTNSGATGSFAFEARQQQSGGGSGTETRSITSGTFDVKF
jgi:hypothetical protein